MGLSTSPQLEQTDPGQFRVFTRLRAAYVYVRTHRHTGLLIAILIAYAIRPAIGDNQYAELLFSFAVVFLLVVALYTTSIDDLIGDRGELIVVRKKRHRIAWVLGSVALIERITLYFLVNRRLEAATTITNFLFFGFITYTLLHNLVRQKRITSDTISMSISVYLLLGFTWGLLYIMIFQAEPGAFDFKAAHAAIFARKGYVDVVPLLIYFSLTTLGTIGYGDITPLTLQARYAAVAEGIAGQFYLAVLVARLVGLYMQNQAAAAGEEQ